MILLTLVYIPVHDYERFSYTQAFTSAVTLESKCLGIECRPSLQYEAARRAAYDNPAIVSYLEQRFDHSPRAAQFYMAFIARAHDMDRGQALFKKLAMARGETMGTMSFDIISDDADVGELARAFLLHPEWQLLRWP